MVKDLLIQTLAAIKDLSEALELNRDTFNSKQAARYMGISDSHLDRLCCAKKISYFQPNGKLRYFAKEELDTWLLRNRVSSLDELEAEANKRLSGTSSKRKTARKA